MQKQKSDLDWDNLRKYHTMSEKNIEDNIKRFNSRNSSYYQSLREDFIKKNKAKLDIFWQHNVRVYRKLTKIR